MNKVQALSLIGPQVSAWTAANGLRPRATWVSIRRGRDGKAFLMPMEEVGRAWQAASEAK